jgi:hypothetical protein
MDGSSRYWVPGRFVLVVVGRSGLPLMVERLEVDGTFGPRDLEHPKSPFAVPWSWMEDIRERRVFSCLDGERVDGVCCMKLETREEGSTGALAISGVYQRRGMSDLGKKQFGVDARARMTDSYISRSLGDGISS